MMDSTARVRALPTIASIVGPALSPVVGESSQPIPGPAFSTPQSLIASGTEVTAVVLYAEDEKQAVEWAVALRRDPCCSLTPIFTARAWGAALNALTDGAVVDTRQMFDAIAAIQERQAVLPDRGPLDADERLLAFLYTRPEHIVRPFCSWQAEHVYAYPLLDAFAPSGNDGLAWSVALRRRGFLEPVELIDRLRECPACAGPHLNFVDACPQCSSIDIGETVFLHCHTCGHVAKQDAFLSNHVLSCPKCSTALRHIGVDYDRALETFSCASCHGRFAEPEVKAHCLHCHEVSKTDELQARRIESFRLSEAGQLVARTGQVGELFALIDEFQCAHPAYFEQTLDFLLNLGRRHAEIEFGLICMKFTNLRELLAKLPRVQVSQMIDGVATRLRELVRTTDVVLRSDDEHCWLLLPQTPPAGVETLIGRIRKIPDAVAAADQMRVALSIASISSRDAKDKSINAPLLMAELQTQVR